MICKICKFADWFPKFHPWSGNFVSVARLWPRATSPESMSLSRSITAGTTATTPSAAPRCRPSTHGDADAVLVLIQALPWGLLQSFIGGVAKRCPFTEWRNGGKISPSHFF